MLKYTKITAPKIKICLGLKCFKSFKSFNG